MTSAVATGDLTRSISVEAEGEVAELKDNINAMVQSLRETTKANTEQDWLQTNLARITSLMQGHRDLTAVAELIMNELIPLVDAQHGTFFLAEGGGGDRRLKLIAGYGLRADIEAPSQVRLGQSLIGQVAKTRKPIVLTDIPAGYVRISSGLGDAAPLNLIVLPIVFEDQVLGVIEAGSFFPFTQVHSDFLEQLMETIGINVNTIIANARTDALLGESQRLAAELQARTERAAGQAGRAAAVQRRAGGQGGSARPAEPRHRAEERADRAGPAGDRGAGSAARPGLALQVAVPRQHVPRAAHAAEQPARAGPAAGPEHRGEPQPQAGRVRQRHPLLGL